MKRGQPRWRQRELIAAGPAVPRTIAAQRVRHRPSPELDPADDRYRRNLVIAGRSGEGPFTIRFADVRYRALSDGGLWSSRPTPWPAA